MVAFVKTLHSFWLVLPQPIYGSTQILPQGKWVIVKPSGKYTSPCQRDGKQSSKTQIDFMGLTYISNRD